MRAVRRPRPAGEPRCWILGLLVLALAGPPAGAATTAPAPPKTASTTTAPAAPKAASDPRRSPGAASRARRSAPTKPPLQIAREARGLEEIGAYGAAARALRGLRSRIARDADLELELALDEARSGDLDSAWVRLSTPLMSAALADSGGPARRQQYSWHPEPSWINGRFDGWNWYVARARAEVGAALGRWPDAREAAAVSVAARPMSGKEWLLLAVCAGRSGLTDEARSAAERAAQLDPSLPEAHYLLGLYEWRSGRRLEAQSRFRAALGLDSTWRAPALALVRSRLPGIPADSLPAAFLTGVREVGLLTSPAGPKPEEFVQMDESAVLLKRVTVPIPDSLKSTFKPLDLAISLLVDEHGRAVLSDLPWFDRGRMPEPLLSSLLGTLPDWRFRPARKHGAPARVWVTVPVKVQL